MGLYSYLVRLENTLSSRQDLELEMLEITLKSLDANFKSEVRFYDGSHLTIFEKIKRLGKGDFRRIGYRFHYQSAEGNLIFRYDNAPHHPHLSTFPSHKHIGNSVVEAEPPDLHKILTEIDALLYPRNS